MVSQVCLENPDQYSYAESFHFKPLSHWFPAIVRFGTSPMHAKPRAMESMCKASRAKRLARHQPRGHRLAKLARKLQMKKMKLADQQSFVTKVGGLRIDFPDKKVGEYFARTTQVSIITSLSTMKVLMLLYSMMLM
jgi:hypothetical protein